MKNEEELPGIQDFFRNEGLVQAKLFYKKYSDQKKRPKVYIYLCSEKTENLEEVKKFSEKLKKFYFYKEIMISHLKTHPFNLKNENEFQQAQKQSYLTNELMKKLIQNKELLIDPRINYKFIEKPKIRQRLFPFSMLFYWAKTEKLLEMRSLIQQIKEKIKKFAFFSISFKTDISMSSAEKVLDSLRCFNDFVISQPIIYNSKMNLSFIFKKNEKIRYFIKFIIDSLHKNCSELNILSITVKCNSDEEYQNNQSSRVDLSVFCGEAIKRFYSFGSGNFATYFF